MDVLRQVSKIIPQKSRLLVGVSGGVDSVVLLHTLYCLGFDCVVAHCNFHLRGDDSDGDALFVESLAKKYSYDIEIIEFDTVLYSKDNAISVEMAARELRYEWFEKMREKNSCNYILVGHNANDSVETFFLNIIRGTGIKGVTGISEQREKILRPLLKVSRKDIEKYAILNGLEWRNDITNDETIYLRNKIRHHIIPQLEELNPSFLSTMQNNMENLSDVENIFNSYSHEIKKQCLFVDNDRIIISVDTLKMAVSYNSLLFDWLQELALPTNIIKQVIKNLDAHSGKRFETPQFVILKDRTNLLIEKKNQVDTNIYILNKDSLIIDNPIKLKLSIHEHLLPIEKNKNIAFLDGDKIAFPLQLRVWTNGDFFIPYGMKGRKKVSDYLTSLKMNVLDKNKTYVLLSNNNIVWVVGQRVDDRYAIKTTTDRMIIIELEE